MEQALTEYPHDVSVDTSLDRVGNAREYGARTPAVNSRFHVLPAGRDNVMLLLPGCALGIPLCACLRCVGENSRLQNKVWLDRAAAQTLARPHPGRRLQGSPLGIREAAPGISAAGGAQATKSQDCSGRNQPFCPRVGRGHIGSYSSGRTRGGRPRWRSGRSRSCGRMCGGDRAHGVCTPRARLAHRPWPMCASKRYLTDFLPGLLYSILSVLGIIPIIVPTLAA